MMLRLDNVRAGYGRVEVLHGIDLALEPGCILGLLGRNGAGKTTTIRAIMGLVDGLRGSIRIGGMELVGIDPHRIPGHGIAWVPQGRRLFPEMSVGRTCDWACSPDVAGAPAVAEKPAVEGRS